MSGFGLQIVNMFFATYCVFLFNLTHFSWHQFKVNIRLWLVYLSIVQDVPCAICLAMHSCKQSTYKVWLFSGEVCAVCRSHFCGLQSSYTGDKTDDQSPNLPNQITDSNASSLYQRFIWRPRKCRGTTRTFRQLHLDKIGKLMGNGIKWPKDSVGRIPTPHVPRHVWNPPSRYATSDHNMFKPVWRGRQRTKPTLVWTGLQAGITRCLVRCSFVDCCCRGLIFFPMIQESARISNCFTPGLGHMVTIGLGHFRFLRLRLGGRLWPGKRWGYCSHLFGGWLLERVQRVFWQPIWHIGSYI